MKKSIWAATIAASVLSLSACSNNAGEEAIVTSKAGDITQQEFYNEMKSSVGEQALSLMVIQKVLEDNYDVDKKEIDKEFKKSKEEMGDSFDAFLAQNGYNEDSYKDMMYLNKLQQAALTDGVKVSDKEIDTYIDRAKTEIHAQHVLVADEKTAQEVKKKLEDGADFAEVAKEYSTEEAAQQTGGDLGWFGPDKMVQEFTDAAYSLEPKKISDPVKSDFGYHIIQVLEKRDAEENPAEGKDRKEIKEELLMKKADQDKLMDKISQLLIDADVKIKDDDLKNALDQFYGPAKDSKK
ncbi:peptidylprolyl isomerase [Edaphobacillus lindanitolerans]|uniref:Foldase protein PrsA n=1 Tax=Edaphobacillus lindanitolerans TaxID=550447 RepID=A0A1U7PMI5_9BACI|nr:peptidylprolyl isomerase [Edaphobacillus lindanitolerans]SIT90894.1 foldase protein PrsA [Edaphobacillus lindanitolerans]